MREQLHYENSRCKENGEKEHERYKEIITEAYVVSKQFMRMMRWAGFMVGMKDERLPKRSETKNQGGCRKRGRPQLRWEDCLTTR